MKLEVARLINEGQMEVPEDATFAEVMQLSMGACLTDEGDIWCLTCNQPNECCICE
jgi:hypothetical protein